MRKTKKRKSKFWILLLTADASMAGFKPDERVRAIDLLYGVMLPSGGECCLGVAHHIAGSEQYNINDAYTVYNKLGK